MTVLSNNVCQDAANSTSFLLPDEPEAGLQNVEYGEALYEQLLLLYETTEKDRYQEVVKHLELYMAPVIFVVGICGNLVCFTVFVATHLTRSSCYIYLAALAVSDTLFSVCMFLSWGTANIGLSVYKHQGSCQVFVYLTHVSCFLSVWTVVAFTVERWFVTCYPLRRHEIVHNGRFAKKVVTILTLLAVLAYSHCFFTHGISEFLNQVICSPYPHYSHAVFIINMLNTVIDLIIPTLIIISCNIKMTYIIHKFLKDNAIFLLYQQRQNIEKWNFNKSNSGNDRKSISSGSCSLYNRTSISRSTHTRATRMLIIVSTVFLVCNVPSHACEVYGFIMTLLDHTYVPGPNFLLTQKIFHMLYCINFSVNFFLYSVSSRSFRIGMKRLYVKMKRKLSHLKCKSKDKGVTDFQIAHVMMIE